MDFLNLQNFDQNLTIRILFFALFLWSTATKGVALWHAAGGKEKNWFIAILILNTAGLLEIAYLFFFAKEKLKFKQIILLAKSKVSR